MDTKQQFLNRFKSDLHKNVIAEFDVDPFYKTRKRRIVQIRQCLAYELNNHAEAAKTELKAKRIELEDTLGYNYKEASSILRKDPQYNRAWTLDEIGYLLSANGYKQDHVHVLHSNKVINNQAGQYQDVSETLQRVFRIVGTALTADSRKFNTAKTLFDYIEKHLKFTPELDPSFKAVKQMVYSNLELL